MFTLKSTLATSLLLLPSLVIGSGAFKPQNNSAHNTRQVSIEITGRTTFKPGKSAVTNGNGVHFGKCMLLSVRNDGPKSAPFHLKHGDVLWPLLADSTQRMLVTEDVSLLLKPRQPKVLTFQAMCAQMPLLAPHSGVSYKVGERSDSALIRLAAIIYEKSAQNEGGQYAVWTVTDHASAGELLSHGATGESLTAALQLLDQAAIPVGLDERIHIRSLGFLTMTCGFSTEYAQYVFRIAFVLVIYSIVFRWLPKIITRLFKRRRLT